MAELRVFVDYRNNPLGVDSPAPTIGYTLIGARGKTVAAHRVLVTDDKNDTVFEFFEAQPRSQLIRYAGRELRPKTAYTVILSVTTDEGHNVQSAPYTFETALLYDRIHGRFITARTAPREGEVHHIFKEFPAVPGIVRARLYATALGIYEAEINGTKVGDYFFTPGFTDYTNRVQYNVFDVTDLLIDGTNRLSFWVADGWYKGRFTFMNKKNLYGKQSAVAADLEILYDDGILQTISTGADWKIAGDNPYNYAGFYDGEDYDAARETDTGLTANCIPYRKKLPPHFNAAADCPVRSVQPMRVYEVHRREDGTTILDFGQNFAGIIEIDPKFLRDETLTVRHGEILNPDGSLYIANLRKAKATITYRAAHSARIYRPRFTYMGFRYVELSGAPYQEGLIRAYALTTEMDRIGDFTCSDRKINKLYNNILWSQRSNFIDIPTDCPQRDERQGYTGDAQVFGHTASLNYHTYNFFLKYLTDLRQSQTRKGLVDFTVPYEYAFPILRVTSPGWGDAAVILPWMLYEQYGDTDILRQQYGSMKRWCDYALDSAARSKPKDKDNPTPTNRYIWEQGAAHLGDWLAPFFDRDTSRRLAPYTSTAYLAHACDLVARAAEALELTRDAERYRELYHKICESWRQRYLDDAGELDNPFQGAYVMALDYRLVDDPTAQHTADFLNDDIVRKGFLTTGFLSTEKILGVLCDYNHSETAFDLLMNNKYPSWNYQIDRGATTIWERWDAIRPDGTVNEDLQGDDNMVSFNHYAFGSVGAFFYRYILGLRPVAPGYKEFSIAPVIDRRIQWAKGSLRTLYGNIEISWRQQGMRTQFELRVPFNTRCTFRFKDVEQTITAGEYSFSL